MRYEEFKNDVIETMNDDELREIHIYIQAENDFALVEGRFETDGIYMNDMIANDDVFKLSEIRNVVQSLVEIDSPVIHIIDESEKKFDFDRFIKRELKGFENKVITYTL